VVTRGGETSHDLSQLPRLLKAGLVPHQQWVRERTTGERGQEVGALQWAQGLVAERGGRKAQGEKGATDLISAAQLLAKEPLDLLGHGLLSQFVDSDDKKARLAMGLSYRQHKSIPLPDNMKPPQMEEWLINLVLPFRAQLLQFEKLLLADLRYNAVKALDAAEASLLLCNKRYAGVWGNNAPAPAYFWRRLQTINNSEAVIAARDWRTDQRAKIDMETFLDRKSIESPYGLAPSVEDQLAFDNRETARDERREVVERTFGQDVRDKTGLPVLPGKNARTLLDAANAEEAIGVLRRYVIDGSDKIRMARDKIQSNRALYGAEVWIKAENDRLKAALGAGAGTDIAILVDRFARMRRSETSFWQDLLHIIEFIANFVPGPIGWGLRLGTAVAGAHEAEAPRLLLQQGQVVDRVEQILLALPGAPVAGDEPVAVDQPDLVDRRDDRDRPMSMFYRDAVAVGVERDQRQRVRRGLSHSAGVE
jgi:hypothetical protein